MKKEKYLQIFNYLLEFSKIRSLPLRDIESIENDYITIWLDDIPRNLLFDCIIFQDFNSEEGYLIEIKKPYFNMFEPEFPKIPEPLDKWLDKNTLTDEENLPSLKQKIIENNEEKLLVNHPEIEGLFKDYLDNKWINDLEIFKKQKIEYQEKLIEYENLLEIYKKFFSFYNNIQQFGEEYELIIGAGLLNFKEKDNSLKIFRHLLTLRVDISFEISKHQSLIKIIPNLESKIKIETDFIIDLEDLFESSNIISAEEKVYNFLKIKDIENDLFSNEIFDALQIFSDSLREDCHFNNTIKKPKDSTNIPIITFSPALILRKRNTRSLISFYEKIILDINNSDDNIDIPNLNDIISSDYLPDDSAASEGKKDFYEGDEIIYFPKKYNEEQIKIVEAAKRDNKVLVQGPPGTGKSHTIANLICHLLAKGKRILVTAYTKRALDVLKNLLPIEFHGLTVNLLGSDSKSLQELQECVNCINNEIGRENLNEIEKEISILKNELISINEEMSKTKNEIVKFREKDIIKHNFNDYYQGTLLEIAEKIDKDRPLFQWYKDEFDKIDKINIINDLRYFIKVSNKYRDIDNKKFSADIPDKNKIVTCDDLTQYRDLKILLQEKYLDKNYILINCADYQKLINEMNNIKKLSYELENNASFFKSKLISDINNIKNWEELIKLIEDTMVKFPEEKLIEFDKNIEINYPEDKSLIRLKNDAKILLEYLKKGNSISGPFFKIKSIFLPKNIKEKLYFINEVKVNGSPCDTAEELEIVLKDIEIKQEFEKIEKVLKQHFNYYFNDKMSCSEKANCFMKLRDEIGNIISIIKEMQKIKLNIEAISSIKVKNFEVNEIKNIYNEVEYNFLIYQKKLIENKIRESIEYLNSKNMHQISINLKNCITDLNIENYRSNLNRLDILKKEREEYTDYITLKKEIIKYFPKLINDLLNNQFDINNLDKIEKAIYFKNALNRMSEILKENYEDKLMNNLNSLEQKKEEIISKLASKLAWLNVLKKLQGNYDLRKHLQAWAQAVKKIGKTGKGKRALKFRKEAQNQMQYCKNIIPCWIMPLYKIVETVEPHKEMYDYVIVDEASQLGPDAIFLLYISKNIIIVGDDKQVSPEYIGVDANAVEPFIKKYLKGIPFHNFYGTEFSFFDHAKRICKKMIILREHFRCMPEIIEFSNRYFYNPEGIYLYPLKQYSENRLKPLESVYCPFGYVEGSYQNIINRVEAEAIANKIAELVKDIRYKDKTFGVITLQGNKQAALIENLLLNRIDESEFNKRKIVCGNSASFQGDERDIMFLSLVTAQNHNRTALTKPEDERRFNVAVSRAKEQVWLFHSVKLEDLTNKDDLRYKLLDHFLNYKQSPIVYKDKITKESAIPPDPFESWFEVDVYNDIVSKGYKIIPQYKIAKGKYRIDLAVILPNGNKIAVECDGDKYHGPEKYHYDISRQKVLERCGWKFFRIRGYEYYIDKKRAMEPLWEMIKKNSSVDAQNIVENIFNDFSRINFMNESESKIEENLTEEKEVMLQQKKLFCEYNYFENKKPGVSDNKLEKLKTNASKSYFYKDIYNDYFKDNDVIYHDTYGVGVIIDVKSKGEDKIVTIKFDKYGIKKFLLSILFSHIKKLEF